MPATRGRPYVILGAAISIVVAGACSTFGSSDADGPGDAGDDASTNVDDASADAALDVESNDGADKDAGVVNLLSNGDFETGGCSGWSTLNAKSTPSTVARSGSGSCLFCAVGTGVYIIFGSAIFAPEVGAQYAGSAWVHAAPDAGAPSSLTTEIAVRSGSNDLQSGVPTTAGAPDDTWERVAAIIDVTKDGGTSLRLEVRAAQTETTCFLVDDAEIYRTK